MKSYEGPRIPHDNAVDENGHETLKLPERVDDKRKVKVFNFIKCRALTIAMTNIESEKFNNFARRVRHEEFNSSGAFNPPFAVTGAPLFREEKLFFRCVNL